MLNLARSRNNSVKISPRIGCQFRATIDALMMIPECDRQETDKSAKITLPTACCCAIKCYITESSNIFNNVASSVQLSQFSVVS